MRNPFGRVVKRDTTRPSLKDRAASLKATAGRVIRRKPVAATPHVVAKFVGDSASLPAPGSPEAKAQFYAACTETDRLIRDVTHGYPELQRTAQEWWTRHALGRALEAGEISPADYAKLYQAAFEREHRIDAGTLATGIGALHALAFADDYGQPFDGSAADADPVLDVLVRYKAARDAWRAHDGRIAREGYGAFGGISEGLAAEDKLSLACSSLVREALETVPTTGAGCLALADFIEALMGEHGNRDGSPQDGSEFVFADVYPALLRAVRASAIEPAAAGAPSPALVGMVAEWERLLDIENTGDLTDEQMSPICDARYRIHAEICAYPVASIADLTVKLPLFRGEIVASEPSNPLRPTMDYQSWCGIVRDVEALGAISSPTLAPVSARRDVMQMEKSGQGVLIGLDPKAMPMRTLDALCDHARTLASVCYGLAAQPRSSGSEDNLNEAGTVMLRLAEEVLGQVIDVCESEARRRVDATGHDRVVRAAMLARPIIEDEDSEELKVLALDLFVMAEG